MLDTTSVSCEPQEYRYEVTIRGADGTDMKAHFTFEGEMTDIEAEPNAWDVQEEDKYDFDPEQGTEQDVKAREYMKTFLENIRYERLEEIRDFTLHWTCTNDGAVYGMYEGDPQAEDGKGVTFVVRLSPEMRIESYSCVSNG